jgi:hypothetical protein
LPLGQKTFEENGKFTGLNIAKVHPIDGIVMEISFISDIKGLGKYPSGKNMGSGIMTQYPPHGLTDASLQGIATTTEGDQIFWWLHGKYKQVKEENEKGGGVGGSAKIKGVGTISTFTNSPKLSYINTMIGVYEAEDDLANQQFKAVGYEWVPS